MNRGHAPTGITQQKKPWERSRAPKVPADPEEAEVKTGLPLLTRFYAIYPHLNFI